MDLYIYENRQYLPPADLAAEIQSLQEELIDERERHLRTLADFKNYRRRIENDLNTISGESKRNILLSLLDIADDLEKAMQFANETNQLSVEWLQNVQNKILSLLKTHGAFPFERAGIPFNHNMHETV